VTRGCSDRYGLQLQVYAGRDPLTARKRWISRQCRAASKRTKQVETELPARTAGQHRGSRLEMVAELIERWLEGRQGVRPISPTTIAMYRGAIDCSILSTLGKVQVAASWSRSLDSFYAACASKAAGPAGRLLPADQEVGPRRSRLAT
jgi:hypothetical protein